MTKEETENAIKVMQAYVDGKQIEYCKVEEKEWKLCDTPLFDWNAFNYRVSIEPQYRPFQSPLECCQEIQKHRLNNWIEYIGRYYNITYIDNCGISFPDHILTFKEAYMNCTFPDTGEPFGIKI